MNTLYMDPSAWDLTLDSSANIALAGAPYSLAQDAASAIRTFLGECWYDTSLGIPYWEQILGHFPIPLALFRAYLIEAALTVPDVASAEVFFNAIDNRQLSGQVQITSADGSVAAASFTSPPQGRLDSTFVLDQSTLG